MRPIGPRREPGDPGARRCPEASAGSRRTDSPTLTFGLDRSPAACLCDRRPRVPELRRTHAATGRNPTARRHPSDPRLPRTAQPRATDCGCDSGSGGCRGAARGFRNNPLSAEARARAAHSTRRARSSAATALTAPGPRDGYAQRTACERAADRWFGRCARTSRQQSVETDIPRGVVTSGIIGLQQPRVHRTRLKKLAKDRDLRLVYGGSHWHFEVQ